MRLEFQGYLEGHEAGLDGVKVLVYYTALTMTGLTLNIYVDASSGLIADAYLHEPIN